MKGWQRVYLAWDEKARLLYKGSLAITSSILGKPGFDRRGVFTRFPPSGIVRQCASYFGMDCDLAVHA